MRTKSIVFAALAGPLMIASGASAAFEDASVLVIDTADGMTTYHVFANFSVPSDELLGVGGVPGVGVLSFESSAALFNDGMTLAGLKTEDFPAGAFTGPRDSWVSIGDNLGFPNPTDYSPGFAGSDGVNRIIEGTSFSEANGGWFNSNPGVPVAGSQILMAQFTLPSDATWSLAGVASWTFEGQPPGEFNSDTFVIPTPGVLALLGLAGVAGTRRRRG